MSYRDRFQEIERKYSTYIADDCTRNDLYEKACECALQDAFESGTITEEDGLRWWDENGIDFPESERDTDQAEEVIEDCALDHYVELLKEYYLNDSKAAQIAKKISSGEIPASSKIADPWEEEPWDLKCFVDAFKTFHIGDCDMEWEELTKAEFDAMVEEEKDAEEDEEA